MAKTAQFLLLILTILLNPAIAAESDMDAWQHKPLPECHSIDCGMSGAELCGDDCAHPMTGCCNPVSSAALAMSESVVGQKRVFTGLNSYRDNYHSIVLPRLFPPPRQVV